jgi:hypothetical protein
MPVAIPAVDATSVEVRLELPATSTSFTANLGVVVT